MKRHLTYLLAAVVTVTSFAPGCSPQQPFFFFDDGDLSHYKGMATEIEYPDVDTASLSEVVDPPAPLTLDNMTMDQFWDLGLEEAVRYSLENAKVMRTLGGSRAFASSSTIERPVGVPDNLIINPQGVRTVYDPAITETSTAGVEQALSEFDAEVFSSLFWENTDRPVNAQTGGVLGAFTAPIRQQDLATFIGGIRKRTATGAQFSIVNNTVYDDNNSPNRLVPRDYNTNIELGARQPLLQGGGLQFNRIAGPTDPFTGDGTGTFDGVMLARLNTDISLADFEAGVRNLVADVENAYWQLYYSYRNLEAKKIGRDSALETWKKVEALYRIGAKGGEAEKEAQAREQYFLFRGEVEGTLSDLYKAENRLRYMMGLAATDGRLIRPQDAPTTARVAFDWHAIHAEGLARSVELRQQKWRIKQRELELIAAKNLLLPRLDAVGRYRFLGLGEDLIDSEGRTPVPGNPLANTTAAESLLSGDFQEWQLGLQFSMPLGFRRELATVRNQQLLLARERSRLQDQELELSHQMSDAIRDLDTTYTLAQTRFNRRLAAEKQVEAVQAAYDAGAATLDLLLDAQRRRADAEAAFYASVADYNRSIANVHYRKGSLLEYNGVYLAEGPWPAKAYFDATRRARERNASMYLDYGYTRPNVVSQGTFPQQQGIEALPAPKQGQPTEVDMKTEEVPAPGPTLRTEPNPGPAADTSASRGSASAPKAASTARAKAAIAQADDYNWGELGIDASGRSPRVAPQVLNRDREVKQAQWKSSGNESHEDKPATSTDRTAASWKRSQR